MISYKELPVFQGSPSVNVISDGKFELLEINGVKFSKMTPINALVDVPFGAYVLGLEYKNSNGNSDIQIGITGKCKMRESKEDGMRREFMEETGLTPSKGEFLTVKEIVKMRNGGDYYTFDPINIRRCNIQPYHVQGRDNYYMKVAGSLFGTVEDFRYIYSRLQSHPSYSIFQASTSQEEIVSMVFIPYSYVDAYIRNYNRRP